MSCDMMNEIVWESEMDMVQNQLLRTNLLFVSGNSI